MTGRLLSLGACLALALGSASSSAAPPSDPGCLAQGAGSTGIIGVGGQIPTPATLQGRNGGLGGVAPAGVALPASVLLKTLRETSSAEYLFAVRAGRAYVRPGTAGIGAAGQPWRVLVLPSCLDGHLRQLSADGGLLLAVADDGRVYSHDMPGGDLSPERWTWRWGPYFWTGSGWDLPPDVRAWAASDFDSDESFTDTAGREHAPLGVASVYLLRGDRRTIFLQDPWLPADDSRQVCGPERGTLPLVGLSGSGSTIFVEDVAGGLWTRLYDFDVSGGNTVVGDYSWQRGRPASDTRWQLPGPNWVRHTSPPGPVTERISITKTGLQATQRVLRVEGRSGRRTGVWEKALTASRWTFVPTGASLRGTVIRPSRQRFQADDRSFEGTVSGKAVQARDVNPECSPIHLHVQIAGTVSVDLVLHLADGMRQETRAQGLDDTPREYNGALEVMGFDHLGPQARAWVDANLGGQRITTAPVALTTTRMRFLVQCWQLTLGGQSARTDVPRVPADLGMVVGRTTERQKDGRRPDVCR
ncbi:MAG: hypothetical protein H7233_04065 [Pseudorhodobacter sp.]|nr:hypothetical protein [Frankiaceae bacterium]